MAADRSGFRCDAETYGVRSPTMNRPVVTAVGRRLQPKHGEPQRHHVISVAANGQVRTVIDRKDEPPAER